MPDFVFAPVSIQYRAGYSVRELEVMAHLGQLADALRAGSIGFEWYSRLSQVELARVGWSERD